MPQHFVKVLSCLEGVRVCVGGGVCVCVCVREGYALTLKALKCRGGGNAKLQQKGLGVTLGTCRGAAARACLNAVYVVLRCR